MHGTIYKSGQTLFSVFAPEKKSMILHIVHPVEKRISMEKNYSGYFTASIANLKPGTKYFLMPDGEKDLPDPASQYQPEGVHGPSEIVDHDHFKWTDEAWRGKPFGELIIYELHVGAFTNEGTFEAVISRLDDLIDTGINAIQLLPVAQFPGDRNWGYDGVFPYAVQNSYGGPVGLKRLVDACHSKGISVILDVVYNHLGPEGNYFAHFAPYFTDHYRVPWGDAINFDGKWSDGVREYFLQNAQYWLEVFHFDGLRLDAIHAIHDSGAKHILQEINDKVDELEAKLGRQLHLIAESDLNDPKVVKGTEACGYGFTAQWLDDFHHALYVFLHDEGRQFYEDFGRIEQLAKAFTDGFVHSGEYVKFRKKKYGGSSAGITGNKFIAFIENHDQCGNRVRGQKLTTLINLPRLKLGAAALLLAPYVPMLFMGEEYGEDTPFYFFNSHSDKDLIAAVKEGRKAEFAAMKWSGEPPDPQADETFFNSKLQWTKRGQDKHKEILAWYKSLIELRRTSPALKSYNKNHARVNTIGEELLALHRTCDNGQHHILAIFNFSEREIEYPLLKIEGEWIRRLDSLNNFESGFRNVKYGQDEPPQNHNP